MEGAIVFLMVMVGFMLFAISLYIISKVVEHFEDRHVPKDKNYDIELEKFSVMGTQIRPGSDPDHGGSFRGF